MSESAIQAAIREVLVRTGKVTLWRNNTGMDLSNGRAVRYGLGVGSADLVGFLHGSGRFFALEIKTPKGRTRPEQQAWVAHVNRSGGFARVVRSIEEALTALHEANIAQGAA